MSRSRSDRNGKPHYKAPKVVKTMWKRIRRQKAAQQLRNAKDDDVVIDRQSQKTDTWLYN